MSRFRFFRVHKYVIFELMQMARLLAVTNFNNMPELKAIEPKLASLINMLKGHSAFEDGKIFQLLKSQGVDIARYEADHHEQHALFEELANRFNAVKMANDAVVAGESFYVYYRTFMANMILHMDAEERELWPLFKKHCTEEQMREVQSNSYQQMTPQQILEMLTTLFPHFNRDDKVAFCNEVQAAVPDKWEQIVPHVQKIV